MKNPRSVRTALLALGIALPGTLQAERRNPPKGLLFYAKYGSQADTAALRNPNLRGALFQIYWSDVEKSPGRCDWSVLDGWLAPWKRAGKGVALRVLWSASGYWPDPSAKTPTPAWVFAAGAAKVVHGPSGTEIPLFWDPVYRKHALAFLRQLASRYDADSAVLFLDATPGAETNPYRFGTLNDRDTGFPSLFRSAMASDGSRYGADRWVATVKAFVDSSTRIFTATPLLVTLNTGAMPGDPGRQKEIGDHCVAAGAWVGQNGLTGGSYAAASPARDNFLAWSARSRVFFETLSSTVDERVGSLLEVMRAGERAGFGHLNIYPSDVLKGTRGHPAFDPAHEAALEYGRRVLQGTTVAARPAASPGRQGRRLPDPGTSTPTFTHPRRPSGADARGRLRLPIEPGEP